MASKRTGSLALMCAIAMAETMTCPIFAAASSATTDDPLAVDAPCSGPASTPACALRTLHNCYEQRDPSLCELVGVAGVDFRLTEAYDAEFPSTRPQERDRDRHRRIIGVREVGPERFKVHKGSDFVIEDRMIGTYEVMEKLEICAEDPCLASASYFFKEIDGRWVLASWSDNASVCLGVIDEFLDLFPHCAMQIPVPTWTDL